MDPGKFVSALGLLFFVTAIGLLVDVTSGRADTYTTVAVPVVIEGSARDGDIVAYDPRAGTYHVSRLIGDEHVFGVIVDDPVLYMESEVSSQEGARPVVRQGEAVVNVSTIAGVIRAGDLVTTSPIPGTGQRANRDNVRYILGFAIDDMFLSPNEVEIGSMSAQLGSVPVALRIGPHVNNDGVSMIASTTMESLQKDSGTKFDAGGGGALDLFEIFRYMLASFVALAAMIISIRRFGETFSQSVISVGRNPLARPQIRSILFWNALMILLISGVGFAIAAAIIFIP
jgi:hypothetical protein